MNFPPVPPAIKSVSHILKVADEHDNRNPVISYWARMYACELAMQLIPGQKPPDITKLLIAVMDWLENTKKENQDVEGITNKIVGQSMIEEYCLKLFNYADGQDRAEQFNKNMIKAFYTSGILMDCLEQFGDLSEDMLNKRKYAKWKAAYIHNCLKAGEKPTAGGPDEHLNNVIEVSKDDEDEWNMYNNPGTSTDSTTPKGDEPGSIPPANIPGSAAPSAFIPGPAPASSPVTPVPTPAAPSTPLFPSSNTSGHTANVGPDVIQKAQKYCKFAASALNYDDVNSAIDNLKKALSLLQTGRETP